MTWLGVIAVVVALFGCDRAPTRRHVDHGPAQLAPPEAAASPGRSWQAPPRPAQLRQVWLKALGMTCEETCPIRVRHALADLHAVYQLGIDPGVESIYISYDASLGEPAAVTAPMLDAIRAAGYDPWLKQEGWPEGADVTVVLR